MMEYVITLSKDYVNASFYYIYWGTSTHQCIMVKTGTLTLNFQDLSEIYFLTSAMEFLYNPHTEQV